MTTGRTTMVAVDGTDTLAYVIIKPPTPGDDMSSDPDAVMVAAVLAASDRPMTAELLLSAARAYAALRSNRKRVPLSAPPKEMAP